MGVALGFSQILGWFLRVNFELLTLFHIRLPSVTSLGSCLGQRQHLFGLCTYPRLNRRGKDQGWLSGYTLLGLAARLF